MKNILILIGLVWLNFFVISCKKDENKDADVILNVNYSVDNTPLLFDTICFTNAAGNHYSVSRLQYYLSNISLILPDSTLLILATYHFFDAKLASTNAITFSKIPKGDYIGVSFLFGLDTVNNKTNALPSTVENISMAWPDPMGGGYHFMKMEGYFEDNLTTPGYAMHLGTNACKFNGFVYSNTHIDSDSYNLKLEMNINEWYQQPQNFDFNTDGNYIMGNMPLMMKIVNNGVDIFKIK